MSVQSDYNSDSEDSTYAEFLNTYMDLWTKNATDANLKAIKCEVAMIANSRRDLESADSMEKIVQLLTHRDALQDASRDETKPRWLVPTLLDLVENYEKRLTDSSDVAPTSADDQLNEQEETDNARYLPYGEGVSVVRIRPPELSKTIQKNVFKIIRFRWKDVVATLPDIKLIVILDACSSLSKKVSADRRNSGEEEFLYCMQSWIQEYPHRATWNNLVDSVAKVDVKLLEAVRALRPPSILSSN